MLFGVQESLCGDLYCICRSLKAVVGISQNDVFEK